MDNLWRFVPFLIVVIGAPAGAISQEAAPGGVYFSTEEDFVTRGPAPADGNPIISDGDLLVSSGHVYLRNRELLTAYKVREDLGLDAADVIHSERKLVVFSTELDHPQGVFGSGDLLSTDGVVIPNSALLERFDLPRGLDLGLDALQLVGEPGAVLEFLKVARDRGPDFWLEKPGALAGELSQRRIDIWFSTEGTAPDVKQPRFLDGDLLSAATGSVILRNADALPPAVPAGIPNRGVDFGMDAVSNTAEDAHAARMLLFSTEINGLLPGFTDGDALRRGNGVVFSNFSLVAGFEPMVKDLGLDALSYKPAPQTACRFTRIGGVDVNPTTWNNATGYVDPALTGLKDHSFGKWVSIRGVLPPDAVEHRVLVRPEGGVDAPILMPANLGGPLGWRVFCHVIPTWIKVVISGDGWLPTGFWRFLRDTCLNPDLIFVDWYTPSDGKYVLTLKIKDAGGAERTCDTLPIQVDNTAPTVLLADTHECKEYGKADMPLKIEGAIFDWHFSNYQLDADAFWIPPTGFASQYYVDGPPLHGEGTVGFPAAVELGNLNIPVLLGDQAKGGRYTVRLRAWDRSLLGAFLPSANHVADANPNPTDRDDRNWSSTITNFEFYP
jgi:hypothetical protein